MSQLYYTFILRFSQATLDASVTLVLGVIIAGIIRRMVGPEAIRRLFGVGVTGSLRGWTAGMLLPVCSLGVIPVARELRRSGVPGGIVLAFVLTGPLLNPISFLYGLTLGEPKVILTFAAITLAKTALVAFLWDRWFGGTADAALATERASLADAERRPAAGIKRMLSILVTAARELTGRDVIYYLIGLLGSALLASCIPFAALQHAMAHHDHMAPLRMLGLSVPAYMSPLSGMVRIGSMFEHGNSIGGAFILLVLGIGMCLGTLAWLIRDFGRRFIPWFFLYALIVLGLAYACEPLLWDSRKVEVDHTHAFDDLSSPFMKGRDDASNEAMREIVERKLAAKFGVPEKLSLGCLFGLLALGIGLRLADRSGRVENWLVARPVNEKPGRWDPNLSGIAVGGFAILGLIAFSVVGAYIYYPNREFCLEKMRYLSADTRDLMIKGKVDESILYIEQWDLIARQLQVGTYIRDFGVTDQQAKAVDDLREALEVVRDDLRARNLDEAKRKLDEMIITGEYRTCVKSYTRKRTA